MDLPILGQQEPEDIVARPEYQAELAQMRVHLGNLLAMPGLEGFTQSLTLPQAYFDELNAFLACYDRLIDFATRTDGSERQIKCSKGCCNCCIDLVRGIFTAEIVNIYRYVRAWPDAKQVFEYHRDSAEMFMDILAARLRPGETAFGGRDERIIEAHVEFNARNRPCGFLDQATGCCRIYPVRPIACRYFFSLDPPEMCTPTHEMYLKRRTRTVHLPEEMHELLMKVGHRLGFRPLNYLSGAFCGFAAEVMHARQVRVSP